MTIYLVEQNKIKIDELTVLVAAKAMTWNIRYDIVFIVWCGRNNLRSDTFFRFPLIKYFCFILFTKKWIIYFIITQIFSTWNHANIIDFWYIISNVIINTIYITKVMPRKNYIANYLALYILTKQYSHRMVLRLVLCYLEHFEIFNVARTL